jgi:hypothetical protein
MLTLLNGSREAARDALHHFWRQDAIRMPFFQALLGLFVIADLTLILIHILYITGVIVTRLYSIQNDQGYAEFYQALKEGWLVLIFAWYALQSRNWRYLSWAAIFFYVLLDDFLMVHERVGEVLAITLNLQGSFGLRGQDMGELIVFGCSALILLPMLALAYRFGNSTFRRDTLVFVGALLLYIVFALGVDMLHIPFLDTPYSDLFGLLEDGGELVIISLMLWMGFLLLARGGINRSTNC